MERIEYFYLLPEMVALKCIKNTIAQSGLESLEEEIDSFEDAIGGAFVFSDTIEGEIYWLNIDNKISSIIELYNSNLKSLK